MPGHLKFLLSVASYRKQFISLLRATRTSRYAYPTEKPWKFLVETLRTNRRFHWHFRNYPFRKQFISLLRDIQVCLLSWSTLEIPFGMASITQEISPTCMQLFLTILWPPLNPQDHLRYELIPQCYGLDEIFVPSECKQLLLFKSCRFGTNYIKASYQSPRYLQFSSLHCSLCI